jgi:hypothetical protein
MEDLRVRFKRAKVDVTQIAFFDQTKVVALARAASDEVKRFAFRHGGPDLEQLIIVFPGNELAD